MRLHHSTTPQNRVVVSPQSTQPIVSGTILYVELEDDESVEWLWSHFSDRPSMITGYIIIKNADEHPCS